MAPLNAKLFNRLGVKLKSSVENLSSRSFKKPQDLDVCEGDDVGGFTLLSRLGTGTYSSVWLAISPKESRHVIIKIPTGHAQQLTSHKSMGEAAILQRVQETGKVSRHPGRPYVLSVEEVLEHATSRGLVKCLTFPLLGPSLPQFLEHRGSRRLPPMLVKRITKQILLGLAYLHDECGIFHGDLRSSHLLFTIDDTESFVKSLGSSSARQSISREVPPFTAQALFETDRKDFDALNVRLIDLGHANFVNKHFTEVIQGETMRAPEVMLHAGWSTSADMWNLGCLVFELFTGLVLFRPRADIRWSKDTERILQMSDFLEASFPVDLIAATPLNRGLEFFEPNGQLKHASDKPGWTLEYILVKSKVPVEDRAGLQAFLKTMLRLRPGDRARAAMLVDHPWLNTTLPTPPRSPSPPPPARLPSPDLLSRRSSTPVLSFSLPPSPSGELNIASRTSTMSSFGDMLPPMVTIPTRRPPQGVRPRSSKASFHIEEVERSSP